MAAPRLLAAVPEGAPARCSGERRQSVQIPRTKQISSGGAPPNKRLELAGLPGRSSVDRLMTWEAAVETLNSWVSDWRPQLKRSR
jgi:hypothetical protein